MEEKRKYNLDERLIEFEVLAIKICEGIYKSPAGIHLSNQLVRSSTSPALHYGEAQSTESRADFIYKLKIAVKELRESKNGMRIIVKVPLTEKIVLVNKGIAECDELISIFVKSIETAKKNLLAEKTIKK